MSEHHGVEWGVRLALFAALLLLAGLAMAQVPDVARGRVLYENHCIACHTPNIHTRPNRIAITRAELRDIVRHWQRQQSLTWSAQDTEDVVEFLARTRYHLAPAADRVGRN